MAQQPDSNPQLHAAAHAPPFDKIWLPRALYQAIPYFYLLSGIAALFATLYVNAGSWLAPQWIIFTALCFHAGVRILWLRFVNRRDGAPVNSAHIADG